MKKLAIWFASLSLLGLCAAGPALAANYAVCVGINNYKSSYCSNPLNGSVPDARHMTNLITARGEWTAADVSFLSDSGATRTKIRQAVSNVAAKAKSGDHFLYYHSSHGGNDNYYFTTNSGNVYLHYDLDANGVKNYICSYDADYTAKQMATDLAAFPAGVKIVVMLDTCHSAGMFKYNTTAKSRKALSAKLAEAKATAAEDGSQDGGASAEAPAPENSVAGFFMQAVLDQLRQEEADQVRRGLRPRTAASMATDVGWIAAADYDQYSWDGSDGGAFTEAFINGVTNKNKMCDNATYGNQDGYASFYEGWNYAKDIAKGQRDYSAWEYDSDAGYYDYIWTDAQCTNTTVLNNVLVGWAGKDAPSVAPTFPSATATAGGYVGGEVEYTFSASGSSPITYTLSTSVSSSLYDFENGYLLFTPSAAGTYTFTCTAANSVGSSTCTLTVTVTEPPPATPEVPSTPPAAATTSFTASWSAVSDAASYKLYVQQKVAPAASARAAGDSSILSEDFSDFTAGSTTDISSSLDSYTSASGWTGSKVYSDSGRAKLGSSSANGWIATPALDLPAGAVVSCTVAQYGSDTGTVTIGLSTDGGSTWTALGEAISPTTEGATCERTVETACTGAKIRFASSSKRFYLDDVTVTGSSDTWVDIPGSPFTVSGTSKTVSGLSADTEYRYSVAAVNAAGVESEPSSYVPVTTAAGDSAPAFPSSTDTADILVNGELEYTFSASGSPAPTYTLSTSVPSSLYEFDGGYLVFTPSAAGTYTFTCTAANSEGSDTCTLTVTVSAAPVTVPTLLVGDETATTAYATWDECTGVSSYTLQLASDDQFTTGGGSGGEVTLFSNDATDPSAAPDGWTYNLHNTSGSYLQLMSGNYVVTEAFDASACTDLTLSLYMRTYGGTTYPSVTVEYSTDGGTTWSEPLGTLSAANTTMAERTLDVSDAAGASSVRLRIASTSTSSSVGVGIKTIVLTGTESAGDGSLISSTTVNGTEYTFTGLTPYTVYYARVKGNADWSNVEEFITEEETVTDTAPSWKATFPATGSVNVGEFYTLANVSSYASGSPAPTITMAGPAGVEAELADDTFTFAAEASGDYTFTFTAANGISPDATATLVVTAVGQAPVLTASQGTAVAAVVGDTVGFTVTATGIPAPTVAMAATEYDAIFENGEFAFAPDAVGTYGFTFTASNAEGTDTLTVTVTVTAAPVTVPELAVTNITDTTALATWTACDGVASYTLQLSTNDFAVASGASRSATPILSEDFSGVSGTSAIADFDSVMQTSGWSGEKVYAATNAVRLGTSSAAGSFQTPALTSIGSTVRVVWSSFRWPNDGETAHVGISVDGGETFTDQTVTLTDDWQIYTNTFEVSASSAIIRWSTVGSSKKRFYIDDIAITTFGGDTPAGDDIQEFTVPGTSYEFTGLTPFTVYYARVKGNSYWSNTEEFITEEETTTDTAPSWSASFPATGTVNVGELYELADIASYVSGSPTPVITFTTPDGVLAEIDNGNFQFIPEASGDYTFTFIAANGISPDATATLIVSAVGQAPVLTASLGDTIAAVVGDTVEFTVTATGIPAPTVAMATTGYDAIFENGEFLFAPDAVGTYAFTFTASNTEGTDTLTVTVTVTAAPVTVPTLLVGDVTDTTAYATWDECTGVASYTLQLSTAEFAAAGGASRDATPVLSEDFSGFTSVGSYSDTTASQTVDSGTWSYENVILSPNGAANGSGSAGYAQLKASAGYLYLPPVDNPATLTVVARASAGSLTLEQDVSGTWTEIDSWPLSSTGEEYTHDFTEAGTAVALRFAAASKATYIHDVAISANGGGDDPGGDEVQTFTVADTEYTFTDLTPETTYYARVKGNAAWSEEVVFETEAAAGSAPVWSAIPAQSVTVGQDCDLDLAPYVTGTAPVTISMAATELDAVLVGTEFAFTPDTAGTFTFTFTAANDFGSADATLTVTATGTAPAWTAIPAQTVAVGADCDLDLAAYVSGVPTPTISMAETELDAVLVGTEFSFTPDAPGTFTFTFTADNGVGSPATATLTVTATDDAPAITVTPATYSYDVTAGDPYVEFTVTASGNPAPALTASCTEGAYFIFENNAFLFDPDTAGTYHFVFTATSAAGSDSKTVTVTVTAPVATYSVNIADSIQNGTVSTDVAEAAEGETVTVTATPADGYKLEAITVNGTPIEGTTFAMPAADVTVGATFVEKTSVTATYTVASKTNVTVTGTVPAGSSAVYAQTASQVSQATSNNTIRLTLSGYNGATITGLTLSMKSNASKGAGSLSVTCGDAVIASIADSRFNTANWHNAWSTNYVDITPAVTATLVDGTVEILISATENSLYCQAFTVEYEPGTPSGDAPVWSAIPAQTVTVGQDCDLDLAPYVSGTAPVTISMAATELDAVLVGTEFAFTPDTAGTFTFTFTAANDFGTADATLTVTATGTAPVVTVTPATYAYDVTVGAPYVEFTVTASGAPAPTLTATCTEGAYFIFENNAFLFDPDTAGTYHFVFTATNSEGSDSATVTVTVTGGSGALETYVEWLERSGLDPTIPATAIADDGKTYQWHYVTDTIPGSGQEPGIVITDTSSGTFTVSGLSEFRYYQLVYTTDLTLPLESYTAVDLGWGEDVGTETFPVEGDWFGGIRVLLDEP